MCLCGVKEGGEGGRKLRGMTLAGGSDAMHVPRGCYLWTYSAGAHLHLQPETGRHC
jgi:hypothetical protein